MSKPFSFNATTVNGQYILAGNISNLSTYAIASIIITNFSDLTTGSPLEVYIATTDSSVTSTGNVAIPSEDHIEYKTVLAPGESLERTGIFLRPSDKIWVRANGDHGAIRIHGLEFNTTNSYCQINKAVIQEDQSVSLGLISAADMFGTTNITMLNTNSYYDARGTVNIVQSGLTGTPDPSTIIENKVLLPASGGGFNHTCLILNSNEQVFATNTKADPSQPNANNDVIIRVSSIVTKQP
jgi:flagellin-like hook-associated protein FlgL